MKRETAAQKRTRIGMLLADYDARTRELRKLTKDVEALKAQVREIPSGVYDEWIRSAGTPRVLMDQKAVVQDYKARGVELPTKTSEAPIVVTHTGGGK